MSWFNVKIPFGIIEAPSAYDWAQELIGLIPWKEGDVGNDAPFGPADNAGWDKIGSVRKAYDLYAGGPYP